ncbi:MAG: TIGR00266 family protein [Acidobacteriia bacterium]|nr:TIGR00266 family protein [Terriglobia bacterium]
MAFCTQCGGTLAENARFCTSCGQPAGGPGAAPPPPPPQAQVSVPALNYTIQGDNLQVIRIKLQPGQELYAEAGKMIYKQPQVVWETRMSGASIGEKIWGAVKRKLMGESLFLTYFHSPVEGEIGFAGSYPGRIQSFDLKPGQNIFVQRDSFLVAQSTTQLNIAFVKRLGAGFFGGEGFILEKLTGPGTVFIHAGGDFVEFTLGAGESLQVDTGCIVAFDDGVDYDIQFVGGIKTALFGGEGFFLATLRGPGRVIIQSMTLEKMRRELAPFKRGGDEHKGLDAITSIFDSDD